MCSSDLGGNSQTVNHPTVGRVVEGAIIEQAPPSVTPSDNLHLQLKRPDFSTASRICLAINKQFTPEAARPLNSGLLSVRVPDDYRGRTVDFIAALESLEVDPDRAARVTVNERTGTVVFGGNVRISPVAILHGNLSVQIQTTYEVSQPQALSSGQTAVVPQVDLGVKDEKAKDVILKNGATVDELVRALVAIGSTSRDIIAILQNLKAAGALDAEIEVL